MSGLRVADFDFELPSELIAQQPPAERGQSRMLVMDRNTGGLRDAQFSEFSSLLKTGDLLVLNDSRVIPARLYARRTAVLRPASAQRVDRSAADGAAGQRRVAHAGEAGQEGHCGRAAGVFRAFR